MADRDKFTKTMRINLIEDLPAAEDPAKARSRVVVSPPTRKHQRVLPPGAAPSAVGDGEARFQELLQSVYDAALICDLSGAIVDVNVRAVEFFQYAREELCGMTAFELISGADESLLQNLWQNLENERFSLIQAYCIRRDTTFFPAEIAVNKLKIGGNRLCFFVRDITVRRQAEEMLRTEHHAIQNAAAGIAVANAEAALEYANGAVARMWGYATADELAGMDVRLLLADTDAATEMLGLVLGGNSWSGDMVARRTDGTTFDVQISAACNRNSDGEVVGMVISLMDVSDRKRAQEALLEADRNRVMLESLGAACHHLGQPATVLLANLGIIQKRLTTSDDMVNSLVRTSIDAAESLGEILHRLNAVNEYRTTEYIDRPGDSDASSRILEI